MINLKENTLLREIPSNLLHDKNVVNLATSLQSSLDKMLEWSDKINYKMHLESLPDEILDHLLWENHITWREGLSLVINRQQKILLIENAIKLHRIKGTPAAIELIFEILDLKAKVEEWFEYGGDPYHFRLMINATNRGLKEDELNNLEMLVFEYKNVRSYLELLTIYLEQSTTNKSLATGNVGEDVTVYPIIKYVVNTALKQYHGSNTITGETITVYPYAIHEISALWEQRINCAIYTAETLVVYPKIPDSVQTKEQYRINAAVITAEDVTTFPN